MASPTRVSSGNGRKFPTAARVIRLYVEDQRCNGPWLIDPIENLNPWSEDARPVKNGKRKPVVKKADWQRALRDVLNILDGSVDAVAARATLEQAEQLLAA